MKARSTTALLLLIAVFFSAQSVDARKKKKGQEKEDPYAEYVWPPPPDKARIQLEGIYSQRSDVEAKGRLKKALLGASAENPYSKLVKPFAVEIDSRGRILVTDPPQAVLLRFDRRGQVMDVLGTKGSVRLVSPMGIGLGPGDVAYVADVGLKKVVALDPEGKLLAVYGRLGELINPTDAALSPDGGKLYVADSKAHQIVVFDATSADILERIGSRGAGPDQFHFPTSLAFGPEGNLFIVDQLNSRIQVLTPDGEFLDRMGSLGVGFGNFVRPKDVAVDEVGFIYVTDNAFNNVQIFDADFSLLTFVGQGGPEPGQFHGISGVAVRGDEMVAVEQLGHRFQTFRFLVPKTEE